MGLSGTKGNDTPRTTEGRVRADILAPHKSVPSVNSTGFPPKRVSIPLDSTPGSHTHPLTKGMGAARAGRAAKLQELVLPAAIVQQQEQSTRSHPGTGFSTPSQTGRSLATQPAPSFPASEPSEASTQRLSSVFP